MTKTHKILRFSLLLSGLILFGLLTWWSHELRSHSKHQGWAQNKDILYPPLKDFTLTQQNESPFGLSDLKDRIWIANFIFTRCTGPCPLISANMARLQNEFKEVSSLKFVSFSVDPEYDTPKILSQYAKRYQAMDGRWFFLTGTKAEVYTVILENFHLAVQEHDDPKVPIGEKFLHSLHFVLVDAKGKIQGYFNGNDTEALSNLKKNIKELLAPPHI